MSQTPLKPRPVVPLTSDDNAASMADRRDADAMYRREEDRLSVYPSHRNPIERLETAMAIYKFSGPFR